MTGFFPPPNPNKEERKGKVVLLMLAQTVGDVGLSHLTPTCHSGLVPVSPKDSPVPPRKAPFITEWH